MNNTLKIWYTRQSMREIHRRDLLRISGAIALSIALQEGRKGVRFGTVPKKEMPQPNPEQIEYLKNSGLETIAHRAGNSVETIKSATQSGATWVEGDVGKRLYMGHGQNFGIGEIVLAGFDAESETARIGAPLLHAKNALKLTSQLDMGCFIELKRGNFNSSHVHDLLTWSNGSLIIYSQHPDTVRMASEIVGPERCVFHIPDDEWSAFAKNPDKYTNGSPVLSHYEMLWKYKKLFKDNPAYLAGENPEEIIKLHRAGIIKGIFTDLPIINVLFGKS